MDRILVHTCLPWTYEMTRLPCKACFIEDKEKHDKNMRQVEEWFRTGEMKIKWNGDIISTNKKNLEKKRESSTIETPIPPGVEYES